MATGVRLKSRSEIRAVWCVGRLIGDEFGFRRERDAAEIFGRHDAIWNEVRSVPLRTIKRIRPVHLPKQVNESIALRVKIGQHDKLLGSTF